MKKILTAAVALGVLASAGAASAQPYGYGRDRDRDYGRYEQRYDRYDRYDRHDRYERRDRRDRYEARRYYEPRSYHGQWRRGDRLPDRYRYGYAVDYRDYRLAPPPRGYEYRRAGDDVVLAAIATGIIASVLVGMSN
ncbi:RcnB family protein [Caulobacter mirabilis]|nr:RcnB family protein [Caulobacter mirabilis]